MKFGCFNKDIVMIILPLEFGKKDNSHIIKPNINIKNVHHHLLHPLNNGYKTPDFNSNVSS